MHKIHIKRLVALLCAALAAATLAGCGAASSLPRPMPTAGAATYNIAGSCAISQEGGVITVSGTIDVIEATKVNVSIVAQDSRILAERTIDKTAGNISEQFTLTDEQMEGVVDMQGFICCAPSYYGKQPANVYDKYGKKFENITNGKETAVFNNEGVILTFASDWLWGIIPSPTQAPAPSPTDAPETTPAESAT
jgi:hypothetical protein